MWRSGWLALLVVLVVVGTTGCGGDPEPRFADPSPSASSSSSAAPAAEPTPPVMPAAAKENSVAGAKAFVRHFVATTNYTNASLDTAPLAALFGAQCTTCRGGVQAIQRTRNRGGTITGGEWSITEMRMIRIDPPRTNPLRARMSGTIARQVLEYPNGKRDVAVGGVTRSDLFLSFERGRWVIGSWVIL